MASQQGLVDFVVEQLQEAGEVSGRKMFGEYGIFCDGKMVAIFGDDRFFLKTTEAGLALTEGFEHESPYPGAKPCIVIPPDKWDDRAWMVKVVRATTDELPAPKPKKKPS